MHRSIDRRAFLRASAGASTCAALDTARRAFTARIGNRAATLRDEYALDPALVYLNHGAIGTVPRAVQEAQREYLRICESNPALYVWGDAWEQAWDEARQRTAAFAGADGKDLAILRSTTEAFNVLAHGLPLGRGDEVLFSNLNHAGASLCWDHFAGEKGFEVRRFEIPLEDVPEITTDRIVERHVDAIGPRTRALVLPHVDNIVGLRHPVREIAAAARERGVEFVLVDGAQAVAVFPVDIGELGVDAYATSAHKWTQAPKGLGWLWTSAALRERLRPLIVTWGQKRWQGTARVYEDHGTRDLPTILSLGDAVAFQTELGIEHTTARRRALFDAFRDRVDAEPGLVWRSPRTFDAGASLFAVQVEGGGVEELANRLAAAHGIAVRAFGGEVGQIRISPNAATTDAEVERFFAALRAVRAG
jgi:selenocysteine lyase/cysteine desulfurase